MRDDRSPERARPLTADAAVETDGDVGSAASELFDVLANDRRRRVLSALAGRPPGLVTRAALVDVVIEGEPDEPGPAVGTDESGPVDELDEPGPVSQRERVAIDLHHVQLPRLADAGVIEYDPQSGTVEYRPTQAMESLISRLVPTEQVTS